MTDSLPWWDKSKSGWLKFQADEGLAADGAPGLKTLARVLEMRDELDERPSLATEPPAGYSYGGDPIRKGLSRDPKLLLPAFAAKIEVLFSRLRAQGHEPLLWEAYRSPARAQKLSDRGAGVKLSMHCLGAAVDIVHAEDYWSAGREIWDAIGEEAESLGLVWGGRWRRRDFPHIQALAVKDQAKFRAMSEDERRDFVA